VHDFTIEYLRCLDCRSRLDVEALASESELEEGFLRCRSCRSAYPVIMKVPIIVQDISSYFAIRASLGGHLMLKSRTGKMRSFVRKALSKVRQASDDTTALEKKWVRIYRDSAGSEFYSRVRSILAGLGPSDTVLEHGCSIGQIANMAAQRAARVFGIDKSFYAIAEAKGARAKNSDFVVADSLNHPFGPQKFDMVLALNLLDIVEPQNLLRTLASQARGTLVLSDPYDYDRGKSSVRKRMGPREIRSTLRRSGFRIVAGTAREARIPWNLKANPRLELHYKVDLVVAKRLG